MKTTFLTVLVVTTLCILSCKKEERKTYVDCKKPTNDADLTRSLIIGDWEWQYEKFRSRGLGKTIIYTPKTTGYRKSFRFLFSQRVFQYWNDTLVGNLRYEIAPLSSVTSFPADTQQVIVFRNTQTNIRESHVSFRICNDSLYLNYQIESDVKGNDVYSRK